MSSLKGPVSSFGGCLTSLHQLGSWNWAQPPRWGVPGLCAPVKPLPLSQEGPGPPAALEPPPTPPHPSFEHLHADFKAENLLQMLQGVFPGQPPPPGLGGFSVTQVHPREGQPGEQGQTEASEPGT